MNYYQPTAPPKLWTQMSRKKKAKYMDAMKQLYGGNGAKEGVCAESTSTHRKDRTRDFHEMAVEDPFRGL